MTYSSFKSLPPIECLTAAFSAATTGSFSAAAIELGVSHAAVSRRVVGFEAWAGSKIFERHGRGVRPTLDGQRLITRLGQMFNEIDRLIDRERRPRRQRNVRVGVTPSFARFWLLPRLSELERDDLSVEIMADQRHANLRAGEADILIRYGRGGWGIGQESALFNEPMVPVASSKPRKKPALFAASNVMALPLLHDSNIVLWRGWARNCGATFRVKDGDRILSDYGLAMDAARAGLGVALWNKCLHALEPGLEAVLPSASAPFLSPFRHILIVRNVEPCSTTDRLAKRIIRASLQ
jgi:LysR family transcriptional regulator, glycine cleavage system transcriptional activator